MAIRKNSQARMAQEKKRAYARVSVFLMDGRHCLSCLVHQGRRCFIHWGVFFIIFDNQKNLFLDLSLIFSCFLLENILKKHINLNNLISNLKT